MRFYSLCGLLIVILSFVETRYFELNGVSVKTTYSVPARFIGTYKGSENGFLRLNPDGTGMYLYDAKVVLPPGCNLDTISLEWGFIVDDNNEIVRFKRDYGFSYPIIYKSIGKTTFQGCSKTIFLDYILEYRKNNFLTIASSDDWVKKLK